MIYLISAQLNAFGGKFKQITIEQAIEGLSKLKEIGNDTETSGLCCHSKRLLLVQLGDEQVQYVFDIASYDGRIPAKLKEFMQNYEGTWILQNAKFDLQFYYKQGIVLKNIYDTMLAETILTLGNQEFREGKMKDVKRDLKTIVKKYCDFSMDKSVRGEIIKTGLSDRVIVYGATDIAFLPQIKAKQMREIKFKGLEKALMLDNKFVRVLAYIEYCGIKLDWNKWRVKAEEYQNALYTAMDDLNMYLWDTGHKEYFDYLCDLFSDKPHCMINWSSAQQVIPVLEKFGVDCTFYEKGVKKKSCSEKVLKFQIDKFPILQKFYKYQEAKKQNSTYGFSWQKMINPDTGRIHTTFRQIMNTGRLSCGDADNNQPNLQNLPNDAYTRSCFVAEPGNKYIAADYSAQESVVLANFANDESLINFYRKGLTDMHSYVAFLLYPELGTELNKTIDQLTNDDLKYIKKNHHEKRQIAKTAEFAIGYGGNGDTISKNTGCSKAQGKIVYDAYFEAFSGMKHYFDVVLRKTLTRGYIEYNPYTKRKFFVDSSNPAMKYSDKARLGALFGAEEKEYNEAIAELQRLSQNYPIQGSSADCSKLAGILFFNEILNRNWFGIVKIVNMVHDEYNVEAPADMVEEVAKCLQDCMIKAGTIFCKVVPLGADVEIGDHWIH